MEPSATSQVLGFVLTLFVIVVMGCAVLFLAALCRFAGRPRPRPPIAAPAPDPDPRVQGRAPACSVQWCPAPAGVTKAVQGFWLCDVHYADLTHTGHLALADITGDVLAAEASEYLRHQPGGAA